MQKTPSFSAFKHWAEHLRQFAALREIRDDAIADDIARDIGLSTSELRALVAEGPQAADLLHARLHELGLDDADTANAGPKTMSNMHLLCALCKNRRQCEGDLQVGSQSDAWLAYCPNSMTLEAMSKTHAENAASV